MYYKVITETLNQDYSPRSDTLLGEFASQDDAIALFDKHDIANEWEVEYKTSHYLFDGIIAKSVYECIEGEIFDECEEIAYAEYGIKEHKAAENE